MKIQTLQSLVEELIKGGFVFETSPYRTYRSGREEVIEIGNTTQLSAINPVPENSAYYYLEVIRQAKFSSALLGATSNIGRIILQNVLDSDREIAIFGLERVTLLRMLFP